MVDFGQHLKKNKKKRPGSELSGQQVYIIVDEDFDSEGSYNNTRSVVATFANKKDAITSAIALRDSGVPNAHAAYYDDDEEERECKIGTKPHPKTVQRAKDRFVAECMKESFPINIIESYTIHKSVFYQDGEEADIVKFVQNREKAIIREKALAKLSPEEKIALGLGDDEDEPDEEEEHD